MSDRLTALQLFVRVARTGNFSRAARQLGDRETGSVDVHAVFPAGRATKVAARTLADHIQGAFDG